MHNAVIHQSEASIPERLVRQHILILNDNNDLMMSMNNLTYSIGNQTVSAKILDFQEKRK